MLLHLVHAEYWDESLDEAGGRMRDLGSCEHHQAPARALALAVEGRRAGWGPGAVFVTDEIGRRVHLPALLASCN